VTLMVAYGKLAAWYDRLMAGVPYDRWLRFAEAYWEKRGLRPRVVADVGCGTGNTAIAFAASGMRVYGIDLSEDMLAVAAAKEARVREEGRSCAPVVWLRQDMRELELPEPVDAAVSFCDCLNYLLEEDDLSQAFAAVYRALKPGGTFLFDMHAPETLRRYAHDQPFVLTEPDVCYIWTCRFDDRRCEIEHDLTVFVRSGRSDCSSGSAKFISSAPIRGNAWRKSCAPSVSSTSMFSVILRGKNRGEPVSGCFSARSGLEPAAYFFQTPPAAFRPAQPSSIVAAAERRICALEPAIPALFRELFYKHYPNVRRKIVSLVRDEAVAEDLAQETFLRLYLRPPDHPEMIPAWLHRVATRLAYDYLERRSRERHILEKSFFSAETVGESNEQIVMRRLEREEVQAWLSRLSARDRNVLMLRYAGMSYSEIAERLRVRRSLVGTMVHRATERLRREAEADRRRFQPNVDGGNQP